MSNQAMREAFKSACVEDGWDAEWLDNDAPDSFFDSDSNLKWFRYGYISQQKRIDELEAHVARLREAIRLTQEYCTDDILPPIKGWEWFDALNETKELNDE